MTRSREIWCTILHQTISQLEAVYGEASANTIVGNCSTQLVLGFRYTRTAGYFSERANRLVSTLLNRSWLFVSGEPGELVRPVERSGTRRRPSPSWSAALPACGMCTRLLPWAWSGSLWASLPERWAKPQERRLTYFLSWPYFLTIRMGSPSFTSGRPPSSVPELPTFSISMLGSVLETATTTTFS